jgi:hypothetical protein
MSEDSLRDLAVAVAELDGTCKAIQTDVEWIKKGSDDRGKDLSEISNKIDTRVSKIDTRVSKIEDKVNKGGGALAVVVVLLTVFRDNIKAAFS